MSKLFLIVMLVVVFVAAWACRPSSGGVGYSTVGVDEFEQLIAQKDSVVVLDVRTRNEYKEGHLRDAVLIDVKTDSFMMAARQLLPPPAMQNDTVNTPATQNDNVDTPAKIIAVYCRSGRRSAMAAEMLAAEGYKMVNLDGGIQAWEKAGKEIVR